MLKVIATGKETATVNAEIRTAMADGETEFVIEDPGARHNLAVGVLAEVSITIEGSVGYYCGGLMDGPSIHIKGSAGWGVGESMMGGSVLVDENAGNSAGASIRGGLVVIKGSAGARAGIAMKGGTLLIGGNAGYMTGFMMQKGRIIICGDAGEALADSMYAGVVYIRGEAASLGNDAEVVDITPAEQIEIETLLTQFEIPIGKPFKKVQSARKLWNFSKKDIKTWQEAL